MRHPGRHQPARREVAPRRVADLGDRARAVGKGDQHQAMVAQHPLARHQLVGRLGQCLGLAQRLVAGRQHLVLLAANGAHPGRVGQEAIGLHQGAAVWRHRQPVEHPGPGGRRIFLEGVHRGIGRIAGAVDLEVLAPEPQCLGEHRMAHAPGRGADLAPGAGHREDDGLGDLVEDHPPAPDVAQAAQTERAELRLQADRKSRSAGSCVR